MVARRVGKATEVKVTALRAISSGHLHEAGGNLCGYYAHGEAAAIGEEVILHTMEKLEIDSGTGFTLNDNDPVNFNFTTQAAVSTGGTNIGRIIGAKASGDTKITVLLNNYGKGYV